MQGRRDIQENKPGTFIGESGSLSKSLFCNLYVASAILSVMVVLVRLAYLDRVPHFDELYTVLAAQGWSDHGVPRIAEGLYVRNTYYTALTAWFFEMFQENLVVARIPPLIFGSLLALGVFLWTWRVAGPLAGWIAGLFMCFAPLSVEMSQFARFYSLHALLFWVGAVCVYALTAKDISVTARVALAAIGGLCLFLAFQTQPITLIGLAGIGLWFFFLIFMPWLISSETPPVLRWLAVAGGVLMLVAVLAISLRSNEVQQLLAQYRAPALHTIERHRQFWYYHLQLADRYQTLWPVFPITFVAALAARPRPVLFCAFVFVAIFLLLSFAGTKSWRYIFFAMPFMFVIWGIALGKVFTSLQVWLVETIDQARQAIVPRWPRKAVAAAVLAATVVFLVFSNGAPPRTLLKPLGFGISGATRSGDWAGVSPYLKPWLDKVDIVLVTHELHALYYLGHYDITVSKERLAEFNGDDFDLDERTGRPIIASVAGIERVFRCNPSGLIIADKNKGWGAPTVIDEDVATIISYRTMPIEMPESGPVLAFYWERPKAEVPEDCGRSMRAPR